MSNDDASVSIQAELWVEHASAALEFYQRAFGARVVHRIGDGDDIVAQLAIGRAYFWVSAADHGSGRFSPEAMHGATGRTLLVVEDPEAVVRAAIGAGATIKAEVAEEHGWRLGQVLDPYGHEWEIGKPTVPWPPASQS